MSKSPKIGFVSLGCPKNTVDTEVMLGHLGEAGARLTADPDDADVLVINTCGFIADARQESIDAILEAVERKATGSCRRVVVTGCMVQRYGEEIARELPERIAGLIVSLNFRLTRAAEATAAREPARHHETLQNVAQATVLSHLGRRATRIHS